MFGDPDDVTWDTLSMSFLSLQKGPPGSSIQDRGGGCYSRPLIIVMEPSFEGDAWGLAPRVMVTVSYTRID